MVLSAFEQILYQTIFQINPATITAYGTVQDRLLYLLAIPSFIMALFLISAMKWISPEHKGMQRVGGILIYLFLVLGGWYGSMLVPIFAKYFIISIGLMLVMFFLVRIIPPIYVPGMAKLGGAIAGKVGEATIGKQRKRKELEHQLEEVDRGVRQIEHRWPRGTKMPEGTGEVYSTLLVKREQLRRQLED
ncbi:MAG: hypothetical protein V1887_03825 [Candidatus Aenigmatarchaeota archaeon]